MNISMHYPARFFLVFLCGLMGYGCPEKGPEGGYVEVGPKHQLWKTEDRHGNFTPWAYGANAAGQLGDGRSTVDCWVGMPGSPCHGVEVAVPGKKRDMEFVAGHYDDPHDGYSLALLYNDRVWAWGSNRYGTLGIGTVDSDPHPTPQIVPGIGGIQFISGGYRHVLASDFMCTWGWGDNSNNQLGLGSGAAAVITIPTVFVSPARRRY